MESERLFYREIELFDADFIVKERSDPDVYQYFINPHQISLAEHLNWFCSIYPLEKKRTDYIAIEKKTLCKVGIFAIIINNETVEINYLINKKYQRQGFAKEGIEFFLSFANKEYHCNKAVAEIHEDNKPSLSLAKKMGFHQENISGRIIRFEKQL